MSYLFHTLCAHDALCIWHNFSYFHSSSFLDVRLNCLLWKVEVIQLLHLAVFFDCKFVFVYLECLFRKQSLLGLIEDRKHCAYSEHRECVHERKQPDLAQLLIVCEVRNKKGPTLARVVNGLAPHISHLHLHGTDRRARRWQARCPRSEYQPRSQ